MVVSINTTMNHMKFVCQLTIIISLRVKVQLTHGYLYQTSFNPYNPYSNLIAYDDDAGGSRQFQLTKYLVTNRTYILVLTTYSSLVTGNYQLIVEGANLVQLIKLLSVSMTTTRTTTTGLKINLWIEVKFN